MLKKWKYVLQGVLYILVILPVGCSQTIDTAGILPGAYNIQQYLPLIASRKVGLVINHTSILNNTNLVDTLMDLGINVKGIVEIGRIFTPEHGFKGFAEAGTFINDEIYSKSAIPIISLYGGRLKPDQEDLEGIEIMIFDLQDVGVRFYTYLSTLVYVMEACAEQQIPLIVLDRPNPNGHYIDGPVLDVHNRSFIGMHPVPVVYGMTIGEYALMVNGEHWLTDSVLCELTVVKCQNYTHNTYYTLPVPPSPNLPDMRSVYLYPSTAFFEGTVVSEGRGTDFPFQVIGHPGYSDHSFSFIPRSITGKGLNPKFKDIECFGIDLRDKSINSLRNEGKIDIQYLMMFYNELAIGDSFFIDYFDLLAGSNVLRDQIIKGFHIEEIRKSWEEELMVFKKIRVKYLLYPDFE